MYQYMLETIIGKIYLLEDNGFIIALTFDKLENNCPTVKTELIEKTIVQLEEYFSGKRREFTVPLFYQGTNFQHRVWDALQTIPYGETRSYQDIAKQVGSDKSCRAVGTANHNNPISIIVPCHRVIGKNGSLVGYGGGLSLKEKLLEIESINKKN